MTEKKLGIKVYESAKAPREWVEEPCEGFGPDDEMSYIGTLYTDEETLELKESAYFAGYHQAIVDFEDDRGCLPRDGFKGYLDYHKAKP